jgi:hypothetical protein
MKNYYQQNPDYKSVSPSTAGFLGLIPFMGAIYNGTYLRALYQFVVLLLIILFCDAADIEAIGVLGGLIFYVYTIVDAYRTAKLIRMGIEVSEYPALTSVRLSVKVQAGILVALGLIFLLHNFSLFSLRFVGRLWPLILIGAGIYLFMYRKDRPEVAAESAPAARTDFVPPPPVVDTEAEAETRAYTPPSEDEDQSDAAEADQTETESDTPPRGDQQ